MARPAIHTVDCDEPMYLEDLDGSRISNYNFERCLNLYNYHVPPWYRPMDVQRFETIPDEVTGRPSLFLYKQELLDLNRWIQKRGQPRHFIDHKVIEDTIGALDNQDVMTKTGAAFSGYSEEEPISALISLEGGLDGVDQDAASLLLSVAHPSTMPFLSQELRQWLVPSQAHTKTFTHSECRDLLHQVKDLRARLGDFKAVQLEKVAFVLKCEREMIEIKDSSIRVPSSTTHVSSGASGYIYVVEKEERKVAIKRIPVVPNLDRYGLFREIRHSWLLSQKSPRHFVQFLGWNEDPQNILFAMEHIEFGDLGRLLVSMGASWKERDTRSVTRQILQALKVIHEASMAHRDLKPENILVVSNQPGKIHIKVCDFGISKRLSARGTSVYRTYCGTRAYKAPEIIGMIQEGEEESGTNNTNSIPRFLYNATVYRLYSKFRGRHSTGAYTEKVDLWSLGCIIYKMDQKTDLNRTGATPTEARTNKELRKKLEKMSIERSGIEFVKRLIQYDSAKRPSAADALQRNTWLAERQASSSSKSSKSISQRGPSSIWKGNSRSSK